jgi:hypothetical protein
MLGQITYDKFNTKDSFYDPHFNSLNTIFFVTTLILKNNNHGTSLKPSLGTLDPGLKMREPLQSK